MSTESCIGGQNDYEAEGKYQEVLQLNPTRDELRAERMLRFIQALKADSRKPLSALSCELGIPVSTLSDYMGVVRKHYCFTLVPLDFIGVAELALLQQRAAQSAENKKQP